MIRNRFFINVVFVAGLSVVVACLLFGVARHASNLPLKSKQGTFLYVAPGDGLLRIAYKLKQQELLPYVWHMVIATRMSGMETRLQAGEYQLQAGMTIGGLIKKLASGEVYYRKVVVPEGMSVRQLEDQLREGGCLDWAEYTSPLEGSLLPETYFYSRGEKASALIGRMQAKMAELLEDAWANRSSGIAVSNKEEALILASIVEKETGLAAERPKVAAVFNNRLKKGMRLQSDPTVVYGITYGLPLGRRISASDLRADTGFNTYRINGLPPTPIANPGAASIRAVLQPADVTYLYFVADGTGGHAFANTLQEHNRNVRRWRRIRDGEVADAP